MPRRAETDQQLLDRIGLAAIEKRERVRRNRNRLVALAFMSPALVLVVGVLLVPVGINVYLSFMNWRKFTGINEFAGLANYADLGSSPYFFDALVNTVIWVAASLVFPILIGLGLALLFRGVRFEETFKNIVFLPRILAPTAVRPPPANGSKSAKASTSTPPAPWRWRRFSRPCGKHASIRMPLSC